MKLLNKLSICCFLIGSIMGCNGNNNEIDSESLKINLTICEPLDELNSNNFAELMKTVLGAFQVENVNYVSKATNGKLGVNLRNSISKDWRPFNLEHFEGNGMRDFFGVYDNLNLEVDLTNFDLKKSINFNGLDSLFYKKGQSKDVSMDTDLTIFIDQEFDEKSIVKLVKKKLSANRNNAVVNLKIVNYTGAKAYNARTVNIENNVEKLKGNEGFVESRSENKTKNQLSEKTMIAFRNGIKLNLVVDETGKTIHWDKRNKFGDDFSFKIEFIDYVSGSVVCGKSNYSGKSMTASYILANFDCIKPTNRYILKVTTQASLNGFNEVSDCCSIGFQSGRFSEDCQCDNTCN